MLLLQASRQNLNRHVRPALEELVSVSRRRGRGRGTGGRGRSCRRCSSGGGRGGGGGSGSGRRVRSRPSSSGRLGGGCACCDLPRATLERLVGARLRQSRVRAWRAAIYTSAARWNAARDISSAGWHATLCFHTMPRPATLPRQQGCGGRTGVQPALSASSTSHLRSHCCSTLLPGSSKSAACEACACALSLVPSTGRWRHQHQADLLLVWRRPCSRRAGTVRDRAGLASRPRPTWGLGFRELGPS